MTYTKYCHDDKTISVEHHGEFIRLPISEIVYFKAENKYVTIRTAKQEYLTTKSLKILENAYPSLFIRIHRNALVSLPLLQGLSLDHDSRACATFKGIEDVITVSRRSVAYINKLIIKNNN
jgi:two-component system response regulator AlgR